MFIHNQRKTMFLCNFPLNCIIVAYIIVAMTITAVAAENGEFEPSNIVFTAASLKRQRSFEFLTSSAVTNHSVIELSRAAEAFSLEYFQVNPRFLCGENVQKNSNYFSFQNSVCRETKPIAMAMSSFHRYRFGQFYCY